MRYRENYNLYVQRKRNEHGSKFDPSDLAPQFIPYFENGIRIRVQFAHGGEYTGTVGVTTGWRPVFLLMRTPRAMGSHLVLGRDDVISAIKRGRIYVPARAAA